MPDFTIKPGDALNTIAAKVFPGENVSRFTEILDQIDDPEKAVQTLLGDLIEGQSLALPSVEQIESFAEPVLQEVAASLGGAKGFLGQLEGTITDISQKLPPELQGYSKEALRLIGEANGVLGKVEGVLGQAKEKLRDYKGQATNLIGWLLSGKS